MKQSKGFFRALVAGLCLSLCLPLAACGNSGEGNDPGPKGGTLEIVAPKGEVVSYASNAARYLVAENPSVSDYFMPELLDSAVPVVISWNCDVPGVTGYEVEYATASDYSDAIKVTAEKDATSVEVYNLYKGSEYYLRVTALCGEQRTSRESTFTTTDLGPRVMQIDGVYNVRDLGGYDTPDGRIRQGLIYRGGALSPSNDYSTVAIRESGKTYISQTLGIKLEMDLRSQGENLNVPEGESVIPGATMKYFHVDGYSSAFNNATFRQSYKNVFSALAVRENYPIYMHCTGGADRTGTVSFLLNALLGVDESDLIHDYEFTSFSFYGVRDSKTGFYADYFIPFRNTLETFEGETLAEKTASYLLSIGVTQDEIDSIRSILIEK